MPEGGGSKAPRHSALAISTAKDLDRYKEREEDRKDARERHEQRVELIGIGVALVLFFSGILTANFARDPTVRTAAVGWCGAVIGMVGNRWFPGAKGQEESSDS